MDAPKMSNVWSGERVSIEEIHDTFHFRNVFLFTASVFKHDRTTHMPGVVKRSIRRSN